jgi:O-Antigen ligase
MRAEIELPEPPGALRERIRRLSAAGTASSLGPAALVVGIVVGVSAAEGGYYETTWGWLGVGLAWLTAVGVIVEPRLRLGRLALLWLGGLCGLLAWIALSALWSEAVEQALREAQRALLYPLGALGALLLLRRCSVQVLLGSLSAAITLVSAYGLATRLFPDELRTTGISSYRLYEPLGYWNALGIFAAMGALLALGFAARGRTLAARALAGAALPLLVATLYFTYSRGGWIALGVGLLCALALDPRRLQSFTAVLILAPWPALAVWLASRPDPLNRSGFSLGEVSSAGQRYALVVVGLAAAAGATSALIALAERRLRFARPVRLAYGAGILLLAVAALAAIFVRYGGPVTLTERGWSSFKSPPASATPDAPLNERLFSVSSGARYHQWRVAYEGYREHPWVGAGAGGYEALWYRERPFPLKVRDAHGLYFEAAAELGTVGAVLVLLALVPPLAAGVAARREPLLFAAAGAYFAYLVHAGVDWDWEMPAVTLTALACGAALVASASRSQAPALSARARYAAAAAIVGVGVFAFAGLVANTALEAAEDAVAAEDWRRAETKARRAMDWAPWSSRPRALLAAVQLERGQRVAARGSLREAIAKNQRDWRLWLELARIHEGAGRRAALAEARRLNPFGPQVARLEQELAQARG